MSDFILPFNLRLCNEMDQHALLCCQKYNFDNKGNWFGTFRGGLQGFHCRINALRDHFYKIHAWIPVPRTPENMDYHLTAILFNMHSAIECFTFALNALGNSVYVKGFWDVTNKQELRQIGATKILEADPVYHKTSKDGFKKYFPRTQKLWRSNEDMLTIIRENHDVSKHRETIFRGGECRNDPPRGFFESLGVTYKSDGFMFLPMAETFLTANPMEPRLGKKPSHLEDEILLEEIAYKFCYFINKTVVVAMKEALANIKPKVKELRQQSVSQTASEESQQSKANK